MVPTPITITLSNEELKHCKASANAMTKTMAGKADNPAYTPEKMLPNDVGNYRAKLVECAVGKYLHRPIDFIIYKADATDKWKGKADVGEFIECKYERTGKRGPAIQFKDEGKIIVCGHIGQDPCKVKLAGWVYADDLKKFRCLDGRDGKFFCIDLDKCRPMDRNSILELEKKLMEASL